MAEVEKISWIGCGKVGMTLARGLRIGGYQIGKIICKHQENANKARKFIGAGEAGTDLISAVDSGSVHFITTNDNSIGSVVELIEREGPASLTDHYFFHTSGAISSKILEPLQDKGAEVASVHPLQVFANPAKALETLPGIYYAIEGTDRAMALAVQMVAHLQGKLLLIPTGRKVLYHVAGVFAANYLMVLVALALSIMEDLGEAPEDSYQAFLPLMVSALQNVEEFGVGGALTGPITRGDSDTIKKHLEALQELRPEIVRVYKVLGQQALDIALRGSRISPERAGELRDLLESS